MNDEDWNAFCEKATNWTGAKGTMAAVTAILDSAENADDREGCAKAVRDVLRGKDGNPFGVRGKASVLNSTQTTNLANVLTPFSEALTAAFDANPALAVLVLPHGRSKVESFDGLTFAASITDKATDVAKSMAKAGTLDDLLA
jgi:hypothetical protein